MSTHIARCLALTALLLAAGTSPASAASPGSLGEYCVEVEPGSVGGIPVYPGGKYCVPGP